MDFDDERYESLRADALADAMAERAEWLAEMGGEDSYAEDHAEWESLMK